jgi:hypothetical protein
MKNRSPAAKALRLALFKQRVVRNRTRYSRKAKHRAQA